MDLQYVTNDEGEHISVIVPIEEWEAMQEKKRQLKAKLKVLVGIKKGLKEVETNKSPKSLESLVNEIARNK